MRKNEFVVAVMIALIVPIAIGCFYFLDLYKHKNDSYYVYKSDFFKELLLLKNDKIENAVVNDLFQHVEFEVYYASGEKEYESYRIILDNISFLPHFNNVTVKWIVSMYDKVNNEYFEFSTGTFDRKSSSVVISPTINIGLGESQLFKFNYYIIDGFDENEHITLNADIVLE